LFRSRERADVNGALGGAELRHLLASGRWSTGAVLLWLRRRNDIERYQSGYRLSAQGRRRAQTLVRSHRLWEQYLAGAGGVGGRHLHENAEQLEHFTNDELRRRLDHETASPSIDPHGAPIPPED
jgi:manganese/zinc/iron transport system permease protein